MSERAASVNDPLPPGDGLQVDKLCDRFELAWKSGRRPRLEQYLRRGSQPVQVELLRELLALDLDYRSRCGEKPAPEEYHQRFPEHAELISAVFSDIHQPATPKPKSLLPKWAVSALVRQATALALSKAERSAQPPGLLALWSHLLRPLSASSTGSPQARPSDVLNSEFATTPLETDVGGAQHTATPEAQGDATTATWPVVGGYEILGKIGSGGMGVVYRARDLRLNKIVALKVIRPDQLENLPPEKRQQWLDRFRKEARAAARSEHANVVTVYDVNESHGQLYYSMRYVEGRSLADILRDGPLPNRSAAAYLETVARAVHHIHSCGVLHRDLKPKNILVDKDDQPHVADFGLAKWREDAAESTQTLGPLGTPSYMSPEQAQYPVRVTAASDIYSLGATLYALLTDRPPFQAAHAVETLRQVIDEDPVPPRQLNPAIARDLERICLKCLQKEPHKRYASAEQLADELRRYLKGEPLKHTRPVRSHERLWRWCSRNRALAAASGLAAALLMGITVLSVAFGIHRTNAAAKLADTVKDSKRQSANWALDWGINLCERGDAGRGMLWLARSLEVAPDDAEDLRWVARMNLSGWRHQVRPLRAIFQHQGSVAAVAFSPDGKTILTGSGDYTAQLWEAATGKALGPPLRHHREVVAGAFSPDGKTILTGSIDHTARLWEAATGKSLGPPLQHKDAVLAVAFSPDGKTVLTGSRDTTGQLWDATTAKPVGGILQHKDAVAAVAFSPDGRSVLTGSSDKTARLWEAATGKPVGQELRHQGIVQAVAFSPDSRIVLTGSDDKTARLWEGATGRPLGAPIEHQNQVHAVAFSPDGQSFVTGSTDGTGRLWQTASREPLGPLLGHKNAINSVAFSPDGKLVLTGSIDKTARLWESRTRKPASILLPHKGDVYAVAFSPDGRSVLTGSWDDTAQLWEVATGKRISPPLQHRDKIQAAVFSPDGKTVLTGSWDGSARLWHAASGQLIGRPLQHQNWVYAVAFSPDGKYAATGSEDHTARLWDAATGLPLLPQPLQHQEAVYGVAFGPDGQTVLTGSADDTAQLWETATGNPVGPPLRHDGWVVAVAFSPDGKTILTGSADNNARLWDAGTGTLLCPPLQHLDRLYSVAFSPNGQTVLTASADRTAQLWRTAAGTPCAPPLYHQDQVYAAEFSPDGKTVLTASADHTARLWDTTTGKPLGPPLPHQLAVHPATFSPDGKTFVTGSLDSTARLWQMPVAVEGAVKRITLWTQVITGMELDPGGGIRGLDAKSWRERRQRLDELGGPPLP